MNNTEMIITLEALDNKGETISIIAIGKEVFNSRPKLRKEMIKRACQKLEAEILEKYENY